MLLIPRKKNTEQTPTPVVNKSSTELDVTVEEQYERIKEQFGVDLTDGSISIDPTDEHTVIKTCCQKYVYDAYPVKNTPENNKFIADLVSIPMDTATLSLYKDSFNDKGTYYTDIEVKILVYRGMAMHGVSINSLPLDQRSEEDNPERLLDTFYRYLNSGRRRNRRKERLLEKE